MKIIDAHTHIWLGRAEEDRRELQEAVDEVPLERIYVSGLQGHHPEADTVAAINDAVYEFLRTCPQARGQVYLNPRHTDGLLDELERNLDRGFCCIKLWQATRANDPLNFPVYEAAIERALPVLVHSFTRYRGAQPDNPTPEDVAEAARRYPECVLQMAHLAGDFIQGTEAVVDLPNVYVDFSGSYGEKGMVDYAVERLGPERVIFGSDMPGSDIYHNLGKVTGADISPEAKELILFGNAERVLP